MRTIEDCADQSSSEIGLLPDVQIVRDLGCIRAIGPRLLLRARHGPDIYEGGRIVVKGEI